MCVQVLLNRDTQIGRRTLHYSVVTFNKKMIESNMILVEMKILNQKRPEFPSLAVTAQVLGLLPIILLIYWISVHAGGFGLDPLIVCHWHPLFSSLSFIYLSGNGIIVFRILHHKPKHILKLIHASINGLSVVLGIIGMCAIFHHYSAFNKSHLYSIHSWVGLTTLIAYLAQAIIGLMAFLYPKFSPTARASLMPYHRFTGRTILVLSTISAVTGINERAIFNLGNTYAEKNNQGILLNCVGMLFVLFSIVVLYISSKPDDKKDPCEAHVNL